MLLPQIELQTEPTRDVSNISCDTSGRKLVLVALVLVPPRQSAKLVSILRQGRPLFHQSQQDAEFLTAVQKIRSAPWRRTLWTEPHAGCGGRLLPWVADQSGGHMSKARYLLWAGARPPLSSGMGIRLALSSSIENPLPTRRRSIPAFSGALWPRASCRPLCYGLADSSGCACYTRAVIVHRPSNRWVNLLHGD